MKKITTKDNSETFYNEKFNETYHCLGGAISEAKIKFIEPCKIKELAKKGNITILDFCFGMGYNTAAAIDAILESNPKCKIKIIGLENDELILDKLQELNPDFKNYNIIKMLNSKTHNIKKDNIEIQIIIGDAKETINNIHETFDAVFFDPFSPKKCPELWTLEIFQKINQLMKPKAILATYSCATHVRNKLKDAGFNVQDGPIFGRKSPATIAIKL